MTDKTNIVKASMVIRKPIAEVFEAFTNPDITTKFWFTKSTGPLKEGESVNWIWQKYNLTLPVFVKSIIPNEKIIIQWGSDPDAIVDWSFKIIDSSKTYVTIENTGFKGTQEEIVNQLKDSTQGFTIVLAGLKAYLEHGIELNLVDDKVV